MALCLQSPLMAQVRILTIGDSTMADYDENINSGEKEQRGWAQMLPIFLTENVKLDNAAKNGRSSKSFYFEYWNDLKETLKKGDYVIIQFGHNDEKNNGEDTDENNLKERGTAPWGQYQKYLSKYIDETRQKGAIPILATPVVRRMFEKGQLSPKGRHNLSEYCEGNDSILNYPLVMKTIATEMNVPLIDMTTLTQNLVESYGSDKSAEIIYVETDKTHLKAMGGVLFSQLFVEDMIEKNILTSYFKMPEEIALSPDHYEYGDQPINYSSTRAVSLLGMNINSSVKQLELSVDNPFEIATSANGDFKQKLTIINQGGYFTNHIYIRFSPKKVENYTQKLSIKADKKEVGQVSLKGQGIKIGKDEILLFDWNLSKDEKVKGVSLEGLVFKNRKGSKVITTKSNSWEAQEIDLDSHRYIEFSVKAEDKDIYISNLSFKLNGIGGSHFYFTALGSIDRWFKQQETFAVMEKMEKDISKNYSFKTMVKVPRGETLYVRIYPWYKSDKKVESKYILLQDVQMRGIVSQ